MTRRKIAVFLIAALLSGPAQAAEPKEPVRIIQSTSSAAFMPYLIGLTMGYFDEAGLEVEVIQTSSGSKVAAAVASRAADVGMTATSTSLFLRNEGVDIVLLAPMTRQYTTGVVFSQDWAKKHGIKADSPYSEKLAALKGARLGTPGGSAGEHILRYLANEAGINPDRELTIVPMGSDLGTYQVGLEQGLLDGFSLSPPSPDLAIKDLGAVYAFNLSVGEVPALDNFLYTVAITNGAWVQENPDTARKVVAAIRKSAAAMLDDSTSDTVRDQVRQEYFEGIAPEQFSDIWEQAKSYVPQDMRIENADVEKVLNFSNRFVEGSKMDPKIIEGSFYVTE